MSVTCLIPFYNERERIAHVLNVISEVQQINQIVCVDDGSTDGSAAYIKANWPQVQLLQLKYNQGKVAAIKYGIKAVENELILMMDADLQELQSTEIEEAIKAYFQLPGIDMLILRRINSPWFVRWYRSDTLLSGERIIKKSDLAKVLELPAERYQLEVAINRYMLRHRKKVRWVPCSATNTYKVDKLGVLNGSKKEFQMYVEIVSFVGFMHMMRQLTSFTKRLKYKPEHQPKYKTGYFN